MKTCYACKVTKPHSEFIRKVSSPDGLNAICRPCDSARRIQRRIDRGTRRPDPAPDHKWCSKCDQEKLLNEFYVRQSGRQAGKPHAHCRECVRADNIERARRRGVPERTPAHPDYAWHRRLLVNFKMTPEDYHLLLKGQGEQCPGCGLAFKDVTNRFAVDHDHSCCPGERTCGRCVRGLLCTACNFAVGSARDSPAILRNLATYVDRFVPRDEPS